MFAESEFTPWSVVPSLLASVIKTKEARLIEFILGFRAKKDLIPAASIDIFDNEIGEHECARRIPFSVLKTPLIFLSGQILELGIKIPELFSFFVQNEEGGTLDLKVCRLAG
jgi:hypothetical protein